MGRKRPALIELRVEGAGSVLSSGPGTSSA